MMANKGCDADTVPTVSQIEYHVPSSLRKCKYYPKSPGSKASKKQRAKYIVKLIHALDNCRNVVGQRNALYVKYRKELQAYKNGLSSQYNIGS